MIITIIGKLTKSIRIHDVGTLKNNLWNKECHHRISVSMCARDN